MFAKKLVIIWSGKTLIILIFILQNSFVYAQGSRPFDSLEIGLQYTVNINRNVFHDFYEPGKGIEGFVETPFYYGDIQAAIQVFSHSAKKKDKIQGFQAIFTNMKWGKQYSLPYKVRWFTGIGIGLYAFLPNNPTWSDPYNVVHFTETELGAGLNSCLVYTIYQNWTMRLGGSYNRIFTYKPIDLIYLSAGIGYSFGTPKWMQIFLE